MSKKLKFNAYLLLLPLVITNFIYKKEKSDAHLLVPALNYNIFEKKSKYNLGI